jgi:cytochrome b561
MNSAQRCSLFVLSVPAIGLGGLINDSWAAHGIAATILHALFGAQLWTCVVAAFYRRLRQCPDMPPADLTALARHLSRAVWLLLYVLMFFCLSVHLLRAAAEHTDVAPAEELQSYLACGLFTIASIHGLAALRRNRIQRNGRLRYADPESPKRHGWSIAFVIRGPLMMRTRTSAALKLKGRLSRRLPFSS